MDVDSGAKQVISVRDLVEFVLRRGALSRSSFRSARRAHEGTQGHQEIQSARPAHYRAEVPVRDVRLVAESGSLVVQGRIDGVMESASGWLLEEIKTVVRGWAGEANTQHWAQAKVYGALFARDQGLDTLDLQLTYLNIDTDELVVFRESIQTSELRSFYEDLLQSYLKWLGDYWQHRQQRDASIKQAKFPFDFPRAGQEYLMLKTGEALQQGRMLMAEAPTGIGKTVSVLYAAVQRLPSDPRLRLAYLTAKTTGHESARKATADLASVGVQMRTLALAARDRLCFGKNDRPCDVADCPFAQGYYDHRHAAMREAFEMGWVGIDELRQLGEKHQVCPGALALDLVPWMDLVVGDYNYAFDPSVRLKRLSNDTDREVALLVDEAHNLPDRARRMFSAELSLPRLNQLKRALGSQLPQAKRALDKISVILQQETELAVDGATVVRLEKLPRGLRVALASFLTAADLWLTRREKASFEEHLLDCYFEVTTFLKLFEMGNVETHALLLEQFGQAKRKGLILKWLCLDPAPLLHTVFEETGPVVFFSATLAPQLYFERLLGLKPGTAKLQLASPFPPENLGLMVHPGIATTYKRRAQTYGEVAELLLEFAKGKRGNYLVFFSSYDYLRQVEERLRSIQHQVSGLRVLSQTPDMSLNDRAAFLKHFEKPVSNRAQTTLLGMAVLGGVFGEGIDLVGQRLIGVAIVGVGLPQICLENNLMKERFSQRRDGDDDERGFDFAYTYPGFNRVLQAAGRLLRTDSDRGVVFLIDERYRQERYRSLLPEWWTPTMVRSAEGLVEALNGFWNR